MRQPDETPGERRLLRFAVTFMALTVVLGWVFWAWRGIGGGASLGASMLAVPVASAILASVGFGWRRKLAYASMTIGTYVAVAVVAQVSGAQNAVAAQFAGGQGFPTVWALLYLLWLTTFPFVMLVLFVGRSPTRLWSRPKCG